jgi:hypothetical protein
LADTGLGAGRPARHQRPVIGNNLYVAAGSLKPGSSG